MRYASLLLVAVLLVTGCGGSTKPATTEPHAPEQELPAQTAPAPSAPAPTPSPEAAVKEQMLANIKVEADFQDIFIDKQKVVVFITNENKEHNFVKGEVQVTVVTEDGRLMGADTIFTETLAPSARKFPGRSAHAGEGAAGQGRGGLPEALQQGDGPGVPDLLL